jgi:hypothetical protein
VSPCRGHEILQRHRTHPGRLHAIKVLGLTDPGDRELVHHPVAPGIKDHSVGAELLGKLLRVDRVELVWRAIAGAASVVEIHSNIGRRVGRNLDLAERHVARVGQVQFLPRNRLSQNRSRSKN